MGFYEWVNQESTGTNVLSENDFRDLTQREEGFKAGQTASARNINSALRQSNLVVCALMDALNVSGSLQSTRDTLKNNISNALNNTLSYIHINGSQNINGNLIPKYSNSKDLGSNDKRWKYLFCTDVNYNGQSLRDTISNINNKINTYQTSINIVKLGDDVGSSSIITDGEVSLCKTRNMTTCTISLITSSYNNSTRYVIFNLYGQNADIGKYVPSSSYYNADPENHTFIVGIINSMTSDGVGTITIEWIQNNYAQIKVKFTNSRSTGFFRGQVVWFNDNEL